MPNQALKKLQAKDRRFASLYARMLIKGDVNWKMLGNVYRPDDKKPVWKAKQVIKRKEIQQMTSDEINKLYESNGITGDYVIKKELELLDKANAKDDLTNAIKIVSNFRESLDMKPKQQTTTTTQTDYLRLIDKDKQTIEAKRETKQLTDSDNKPISNNNTPNKPSQE